MLIDELKEGFNERNISINYHIKTNLKVEDAVYCGLIINELVTNAFKYAFSDLGGKIEIKLLKRFGRYLLTVDDNGKGYGDKWRGKSLGTLLVDNLVKKQLKGRIKKDTKDGVKVRIIW